MTQWVENASYRQVSDATCCIVGQFNDYWTRSHIVCQFKVSLCSDVYQINDLYIDRALVCLFRISRWQVRCLKPTGQCSVCGSSLKFFALSRCVGQANPCPVCHPTTPFPYYDALSYIYLQDFSTVYTLNSRGIQKSLIQ